MWKGVIQVGDAQLAVKLYSAVQDRDLHFTLLDRKTHAPVAQRMVKPDSGEAVPYPEIRKGFLSDGEYVMLEKEELNQLAPQPSRDIVVDSFIPQTGLGPEWFVRPYYLAPDGDPNAYSALARTLFEAKREGLAHWVMRGIEYSGVLRSDGAHLMLITLRHQDEVLDTTKLALPQARTHSDRETKLAEQLILAYQGDFDPNEFRNEHRDQVRALIEAKASGKRVQLKPLKQKKAAPDLAEALEKSLRSMQKPPSAPPKREHARRRKESAVA